MRVGACLVLAAIAAGTGSACRPSATPTETPAPIARSEATPAAAPTGEADRVRLVDVAAARGLTRPSAAGSDEKFAILENIGSGCALFDANGDGRLDVYLGNGGRLEQAKEQRGDGGSLWLQESSGSFRDVTSSAGLEFDGWVTGLAVGDVEGDGDEDLFVACYGRNRLYINDGEGTFTERGAEFGLAGTELSASAVFLDFDRDGWLDLYVANYVEIDWSALPNDGHPCLTSGVSTSCGPSFYSPEADRLYRGRGGARFEDVSDRAGIASSAGAYGLGVAAGDLDRDGWTDIYVANDSTPNVLWRNRGDGTFEDSALWSGVALSEHGQGQAGMGVDLADANGDGILDIAVTNYAEEYYSVYASIGAGDFEDVSHRWGIASATRPLLGWGVKWLDVENDGDLDLFTANGHVYPQADRLPDGSPYAQRCVLLRRTGDANSYKEVADVPAGTRSHRAAAVGDIDRDGDLDLVVTALDAPPRLFENRSTPRGTWVRLRLVGSGPNRDAIGARVTLRAGGSSQLREVSRGGSYLASSEVTLHFGLRDHASPVTAEIAWPSGRTETISVAVNREHRVVERAAGED